MVRRDLPELVRVRRLNEPQDDGPDAAGRRFVGHRFGPTTSDEVYLARRARDGVEVAVRIYGRPLRTQRDRLRFSYEIHALRELSGVAHVVRTHGGGVWGDGRAYLVTEYCGGGSLEEHLATVGRLTPLEVCRIGVKLAGALLGAHRRNIFHRNLKPANVLINAAGQPMLADFALMSVAESDPAPPNLLGPKPFVAPEAYLPELMSGAADIYSLGATLYALLCGSPPKAVSHERRRDRGDDFGRGRASGQDGAGGESAGPAGGGSDARPDSAGDRGADATTVGPLVVESDGPSAGGARRAEAKSGTPTGQAARGSAVDFGSQLVYGERLADLPHVPWALMAVLKQAMAHDPRDRFANPEDFRTALATAL